MSTIEVVKVPLGGFRILLEVMNKGMRRNLNLIGEILLVPAHTPCLTQEKDQKKILFFLDHFLC